MACYPKRSALAAHPATSVAAAGLEIGILRWRGQARIIVEVEARACPLRQVTENPWGVWGASVSTAEYDTYRTRETFEFVAFFGQCLVFFGQRFPFFWKTTSRSCLVCALG